MKRFILSMFLVFFFLTPVHAEYTYNYEWSANYFFDYDINWSFTVPSLLTDTREVPVSELITAYTTYPEPIDYIKISDPLTNDSNVVVFFKTDDTGFQKWILTFGYDQPFDGPGIYLNAGDEGWGTVTITSSPVPIPAAVWLFGTGLLGLVGLRRKIRK